MGWIVGQTCQKLSVEVAFLCSFITWEIPGFEWAGFWRCRIYPCLKAVCILVVSQSLPDRGESAAGMAMLQVSVLTLSAVPQFLVQFSHLKSIFPPQVSQNSKPSFSSPFLVVKALRAECSRIQLCGWLWKVRHVLLLRTGCSLHQNCPQSLRLSKQNQSVTLLGSATKTGPGREKAGDVAGEWLRLLMEHPILGCNQISVEHPRLDNWSSRRLC